MNKDIRMYGFELNPSAIKSINEIALININDGKLMLKLNLAFSQEPCVFIIG